MIYLRIILKLISVALLFCNSLVQAQLGKQQVKTSINKFEQYINSDIDTSYYFLKKAYKESLLLKNNELIAESLYNFGKYYYVKDNFYKAEEHLKKAEQFAVKTNAKEVLSSIYNLQGLVKYVNGQNVEALKLYHKAYALAEKSDLYENQSKILINLGGLYLSQKDTTRYFESLNKCVDLAKEKKIKGLLSKAYVNLAIVKSDKNPAEAEELYKLALKSAISENNLALQLQIHINLSDLYLEKNLLNLVYDHLKQAENIQERVQNTSLLFYIYYNYGSYYFERNQNNLALNYYLRALKVSRESSTPPDRVLALYKKLSETNEKTNKFEEANEFYKKYHKLSDSLFTAQSNETFQDIQAKYEVDKKNLKISLLSKDNQLVRNRRNLVIYISILVFITLSTFLLMLRNKIKTEKIRNKEKQILHQQELAILHKEQELQQIKAKYIGQNDERNRLSKEIHDGVGATLAGLRLQLSLVNEDLKNSRIQSITNQLSNVFKELRQISHNLSLSYIEEKQFKILLIELVEKYKKEKIFDVQLYIYPKDSIININNTLKVNLYRIFQELFFNTAKYARAKNVLISITKHQEHLNIIFEDDGIGFDTAKTKNGIGISNIKERVKLENGEFTIDSKINFGTTIIINIPIKNV